ncbi:MAG: 3-hydroxybutyryl-CoA dehydrogenase [Acidimicrobiales bacterium]|nr:3-hydroxybutyryl-CoA dehydrogenase [Acidimicrobiales bacterium]
MTINRVGVVGTGIMGAGIAGVAASAGFEVVVRSRSEGSAGAFLASLAKQLDRQVEKGKLSEQARDETLGRVTATSSLSELANCDLVIEAVIEDLGVKRALFRELNHICGSDTILASNTSTLSLIDLASETHRPDRVCGLHFFNPASVMPLVEIARPLTTSDETIDEARAFVERCGKHPVVVKDSTGFIVNALLFGYLGNAVRMLEQQVASMEDIDRAMKGGCNFPMGPFELYDLIGIDVCVAVFDALFDEYRQQQYACPPLLRRMVAAGHIGRKAGKGFYDYR